MNPLAIAALAGGGLLVYHEVSKGEKGASTLAKSTTPGRHGLDPGMDSLVAQAVTLAVKKEIDPQVLQQLSADLKAAGYTNSAAAVSAQMALVQKL